MPVRVQLSRAKGWRMPPSVSCYLWRHDDSVYGGRPALERLHERVTVFLAEPVNCGPGAAEAAAFRAGLAEIHGGAP